MTQMEKNISILAVILILASFFSCLSVMNGLVEQGLLLYRAKQWLLGKQLYHDIFTVQMPLIIFMDMIPAWLSIHLGLFKASEYLFLLGFILVAYVIYTTLRVIRLHPAVAESKKKQRQFCLLLAAVLIAFQNPIYCFDREYFFFLLALPYLFRFLPGVAPQPVPRSLSISIGIMAGFGFCLKPHCILLFLGLNLASLLCSRSVAILKSLENCIIYFLGAGYLLLMWFAAPDYVHVILPMALATYSAASRPLAGVIFFALALFVFIPPVVDFRLRYTSPYRRDIFYLFIAAVFLLLYGISNNGWSYSWTPMANLGSILSLFMFWEYAHLKDEQENKGQSAKVFLSGMQGCFISFFYSSTLALVNFFTAVFIFISMPNAILGTDFIHDVQAANNYQPLTSFGAISIDFDLWPHIAEEFGASWDTRFDHLWMLPKLFASDDNFKQKNAWIRSSVSDALAEDLERNKPQLIFIDDTDYFYIYRHYVDLVAYFSESPAFAHAFAHYRFSGKIDGLSGDVFKNAHHGFWVYERNDKSAP